MPLLLTLCAGAQDSVCRPLAAAAWATPAALTASGAAITFHPTWGTLNTRVRDNVQQWRNESVLNGRAIRIDNYTQYAPLASMYVLKVCGVPSRHSYADMSRRAAMCYAMVFFGSTATKAWCQVPRPGARPTRNSFFSGHTATVFAGAEMLRMEYRHVSPWIGVGAYGVSTLTGLLRIYNDRHWLGDVLAGAGAGILCAKLSYWLCDRFQQEQQGHKPLSPYHGFRL